MTSVCRRNRQECCHRAADRAAALEAALAAAQAEGASLGGQARELRARCAAAEAALAAARGERNALNAAIRSALFWGFFPPDFFSVLTLLHPFSDYLASVPLF